MEREHRFEINSMMLHLMAMAFMLCDHLWATVIPGNEWMTVVGRLAFPIFAFMIVEGYFHTKSLKNYVKRLLFFAVISEIPFNMVVGDAIFYPFHQNVLWTFLLGISLIHLNELAKQTEKLPIRIVVAAGTIILGYFLGIVLMPDYHQAGLFTILIFYFFRGRKWYYFLGQFLLLAYINLNVVGGRAYEIHLLGKTFFFAQQGFALLALIPIWLYRGKQGPKNKALQMFYYAFYPVHLLILGILRLYILS